MESRVKLAGHPVHPMLIVFPLGLLSTAVIFDIVYLVTNATRWTETAYYMIQGMYPWHRFFHTYVGATIVGCGSVILGRPLCQLALRICAAGSEPPFKPVIPLRSAVTGATPCR